MDATDIDVAVAALVTRIIDGRDMSERGLAEKAGIPQSTLNRLLTGQRSMKVTQLEAIAGALGMRASHLIILAEQTFEKESE